MIYQLLRWMSGIALHWFYGDIRVFGEDRIPDNGPLLVAVNHQNALVDSLLIGWLLPRKITMTAKATLLENPLVAALFNLVGVVPLRRASDESRKVGGSPIDRSRNAGAFHEILGVLEKRGAVLIFPEGKSHNEVVSSRCGPGWRGLHYRHAMIEASRMYESFQSDSSSRTRPRRDPLSVSGSAKQSRWTPGMIPMSPR